MASSEFMIMKPRIFIGIHYLEIGGAESSLIGLLEALDPDKVDIDLFVYAHRGQFMNSIPDYVNLLAENKTWSLYEEPLLKVLKNGRIRLLLARLKAKRRFKNFPRNINSKSECLAIFSYIGEEVCKVLPSLHNLGQYDLAISYVNPHNYVLKHVHAKKKICWIHTDYSRIEIDTDIELSVWGAYDNIISISHDVTKSFLTKFPSLGSKIIECENILPSRHICKLASQSDASVDAQMTDDAVNLCSIGRISYAKNYDNIPYIAKRIKDSGIKFRWFIVGPGDYSEIELLSQQLGVANEVRFVGASNNPYAWLKGCDIYVHPSRFEGKSIVVREAQVLCKPVIITNYPTAKSQIQDGVDGIIGGMGNKEIADAIISLIRDENKQKELVENLKNKDYTGIEEVEKIYRIING